MARPKIELDYNEIEKLSMIQCTQEEIAQIMKCDVRTLQRDEEFCRLYKKGMEQGKSSLRRLQWKLAEQGNPTMLIWLGRNYLKQTDKDIMNGDENTTTPTININITDNSNLEKKMYEVK